MAVTTTCGENTKTYHEGKVVAFEATTVHVHSDRAMLDSGNRIKVSYIKDGAVRYDLFHTDDQRVDVEIDGDVDVAEKYIKCEAWIHEITKRARDAKKEAEEIRQNDLVEVFKGRKVPKGLYICERLGESRYGHYAHLRDKESGETYRYVNVGNIKSTRKPKQICRDSVISDLAMELKAIEDYFVLADYLEDNGFECAEHLRNYANIIFGS